MKKITAQNYTSLKLVLNFKWLIERSHFGPDAWLLGMVSSSMERRGGPFLTNADWTDSELVCFVRVDNYSPGYNKYQAEVVTA